MGDGASREVAGRFTELAVPRGRLVPLSEEERTGPLAELTGGYGAAPAPRAATIAEDAGTLVSELRALASILEGQAAELEAKGDMTPSLDLRRLWNALSDLGTRTIRAAGQARRLAQHAHTKHGR